MVYIKGWAHRKGCVTRLLACSHRYLLCAGGTEVESGYGILHILAQVLAWAFVGRVIWGTCFCLSVSQFPHCKWECGNTSLMELCGVSVTPKHEVRCLGVGTRVMGDRVSWAGPPFPVTTQTPFLFVHASPLHLGTLELCPFCRLGSKDPGRDRDRQLKRQRSGPAQPSPTSALEKHLSQIHDTGNRWKT